MKDAMVPIFLALFLTACHKDEGSGSGMPGCMRTCRDWNPHGGADVTFQCSEGPPPGSWGTFCTPGPAFNQCYYNCP
jgi:hypothetical protein